MCASARVSAEGSREEHRGRCGAPVPCATETKALCVRLQHPGLLLTLGAGLCHILWAGPRPAPLSPTAATTTKKRGCGDFVGNLS